MHPFDEMKSWVGFGPADEARLRALVPHALCSLPGLVDGFYERILAHPTAAAVLRDEAQVQRLKGTLARWAEELLTGPWDEAYYIRRERIGRVHVEVGLRTRGTGLGLAICRKAASAMNGQLLLAVASPGSGACFTLSLPAPATDDTA